MRRTPRRNSANGPCYLPWKERLILKALTDAQIALDFGAGRQLFDNPCIVKLDVVFDSTLDVVGDLHQLPIPSESLDFAFGAAVMEHIRDPPRAIGELFRILRPGGYVYTDWSFLAAYHGYPSHFFNVTVHGLQQAFREFTCLEAGVAPHTGPSWALRSVLGTYLAHFEPITRVDTELVALLHRVLWHPLDDMDARISEPDRFGTAAGVYFFGVKQPNGHDTILPPAVMDAYRRRPELQARFPQPLNVAVPDNLMRWARREGVAEDAAISEHFANIVPRSKNGQEYSARAVHDWPDVLMVRAHDEPVSAEATKLAHWFSRPFLHRLLDSWETRGLYGVVFCFGMSVTRVIPPTWASGLRRMVRAVRQPGR